MFDRDIEQASEPHQNPVLVALESQQ
jgi:hypothetical protein